MPHVTPLQADDPMRVGRYRLAGRIEGMPSSGSIYLARDMSGSEVTIALLDGDWTAEAAERDRFTQEASAARRVAPYCAARILDSGFDGGYAYLVSEHFDGPSLQEVVAAQGAWKGRALEALAIGTATGLAAIHEAGLVHGEFGPDHVVLSPEGPRVIEFGISPPYGSATPSADMRAWAHTVLYAAAGEPAGAEDLPLLPEPLRALTARCLSPDPAGRMPARSIVSELLGAGIPPAGALAEGSRRAAAAAPRDLDVPAPGPAMPPKRPSRRKAAIWTTAIAITLLLLVFALVFHLAQNNSSKQTAGTKPTPARTTTHPPSHPSRSPAPSTAIPAGLAGAWSGQVSQTGPTDVFTVQVSLVAGATSGLVSYTSTSLSCSGKLNAVSDGPGSLKLNQVITRGPCLGGTVTLTTAAGGNLAFSFHGKSGPSATGTLTKASG